MNLPREQSAYTQPFLMVSETRQEQRYVETIDTIVLLTIEVSSSAVGRFTTLGELHAETGFSPASLRRSIARLLEAHRIVQVDRHYRALG